MVVYLLSTCPAANGVRRMPTTYATPDSSHLRSLDDFHTQWLSAYCHPWGQDVKLTSIYWAHDTCKIGCHCELIPSHLDSSSFLLLLGPYSMGNRIGDLSSHSRSDAPYTCCRQATWPLWPLVSSAKSRMAVTLPALSFLAWLSQNGSVFPGIEFIWTLNGDGYRFMHMAF